jgi:hypothetical protein
LKEAAVDAKSTHDLVQPNPAISKGARIKNMKEYQNVYEKSIGKDRATFWADVRTCCIVLQLLHALYCAALWACAARLVHCTALHCTAMHAATNYGPDFATSAI